MISTFQSIRRTPYQSLAAFLVLFFAIFLSTVLFISVSFLSGLLNYVETRPQATVYFQRNSTEAEIFKLRDSLTESDKVLSVDYVSKEDAFAIYQELNKDKPLLLEMVSANILPASLEIHATKLEYLPQIVEFAREQAGVEEVRFAEDTSDRLQELTNALRRVSSVLFIYLSAMSIVVLATTTLFKIAMKKDEIELLRLLGATKFYIRKPYLKESLMLGLTASATSFFTAAGILFALQGLITSYLANTPAIGISIMNMSITVWPMNPVFLGLAFGVSSLFSLIIAFVASYIATQKYLK